MLRAAALLLAPAALAQAPTADWGPAQPLLAKYCFDCHDADTRKGGCDLASLPSGGFGAAWLAGVQKVRDRVRAAEMPPPGETQPSPAERQALADACAQVLQAGLPALPWPPGRVTLRRLSRAQWENSVRDLFGLRSAAAAAFPADDLGYGFDSIGDALSFSTLHLEKYLAAAQDIAAQLLPGDDPAHPAVRRFDVAAMRGAPAAAVVVEGNGQVLVSRAELEQVLQVPRAGSYRLRVLAGADQAGPEPAKMRLRVDARDLATCDVAERRARWFEQEVALAGGSHRLGIAFLNDYYRPDDPDPRRRDRNLHVEAVELVGPLTAPELPDAQWWLAGVAGAAVPAARPDAVLRPLLLRVWRRSPTDGELQRLGALVRQALSGGEPWPAALRPAVTAALCSPHFLFRVEPATGLDGYALATRLSYLLTASTPDAALLARAAGGGLADRAALTAELDRLLADPRSDTLATDFAAQWFELRALAERTPDATRFPGFDDGLRASMRRETELLFLAVLRDGRDLRDLLDCGFTHVDARLAAFYGLPAPAGPGFARVELPPAQRERGGLLGHAAVHAITSNPTRTSPVKRGKWILENVLGAPPPAPQPGKDSFAEEARIDSAASLREQLAVHRGRRECAGCHVRTDALGFALEGYDVVGRHRQSDRGGVIDCHGELPDGRSVDGLAGLKAVLRADPAFVRTALRKLFVYALGRDLAVEDRLHLDAAAEALFATGKVTVRDLLLVVVQSPPFRGQESKR